MMSSDLVLLYDAPVLSIVQEYESDNKRFMNEFKKAWTKLVFENIYTDSSYY